MCIHYSTSLIALLLLYVNTCLAQAPERIANEDEAILRLGPHDGSRVDFRYSADGARPEIVSLCYSGYPGASEWLAEQKHPHAKWHLLSRLESIELRSMKLTPDAAGYIASLKSVKSLSMEETVIYRDALERIRKMSWLRSLSLDLSSHMYQAAHGRFAANEYIEPKGDFFAFLDDLKQLETLEIRPECDLATFRRICSLDNNLKSLSLGRIAGIEPRDADLLRKLAKLESIYFEYIDDAKPVLASLSFNPNMKSLGFATKGIDATDIKNISSHLELESLYIRCNDATLLDGIGKLTSLRILKLCCDKCEVSDAGAFIASLVNLRELDWANGCELSLEHLRGHKNITKMWISKRLNDGDLDVLKSMPQLKEVAVGNVVGSAWHLNAQRQLPGVKVTGRRMR